MARKTFFSFHFKNDCWRASQVRNAGVVEGNTPVTDNAWETIKKGGDQAIKAWIDGQLAGRSCAVVLIGSATAGRKWINYEIEKAWKEGKGLVGIHVHNLKDQEQKQSLKGANPFAGYTVGVSKKPLTSIVKIYDPPSTTSTSAYAHIKANMADWVEEAIEIRNKY